jgi:deoxyribodipyrimidine photo-lyase
MTGVQEERIRKLNDAPPGKGAYVLYWMQQSQRAEFNHALEYAVERANERGERLLVAFGLMDDYPEANQRHYRFLLEGLADAGAPLEQRGIRFAVQQGNPAEVALGLARDASVIVCDRGYLRHQKAWRGKVAAEARVEVVEVEADVVVPVAEASGKAEYAARTIRPKINRQRDKFLFELRATPVRKDSLDLNVESLDWSDADGLLERLKVDRTVPPVPLFRGGTSEAKRILERFIESDLPAYEENRNQPQTDAVSHMSKYLHFGHISPVYLALQIRSAGGAPKNNRDAYLEELLVRRELACNFVEFTEDYDRYSCLPEWAKQTLKEHRGDDRPHRYTREQLENAGTHDDYWNAAMREMRYTGYMHNYMRMYWGKKILEWCNTPEYAFRVALELNNKYFIDGRDPNSYAGVAWVFGKHDRPWGERDVFGKVRYMAATGLERKCDIRGYVAKVDRLVEQVRSDARG